MMIEQERDFEGIWISKEIWCDKRLTVNQKFYLAIYEQCSKNEIETDEMMKKIASTTTIWSVKKSLKEMGLIDFVTDYEEAKELVLQRKGKGKACEWCGIKTFALQEHHYPIPKSKGGDKTVSICPNCHAEYHLILKDEV